jgi:mannitol/fructose-specific phosphotransferase system IIA component (Ntr-type)
LAPLPAEVTGVPELLTVSKAISPMRVNMNLMAGNRDGVLRELVALVVPPQEKRLSQTLFRALKAREEMCSTCVNEGVANPHARNALVGVDERPVRAYGRHRAGVDFHALDGQLVRHFFLLCAPYVREHLQLLARLSRLLHRVDFRQELDLAQQPADVLGLIARAEETMA